MAAVITLTVLAAVVLVVCVLCGAGLVPRNRFAGLRFPTLYFSQATWRAGHRAAILPSAIGLVLVVVAGVVFHGTSVGWIVGVALFFVCLGLAVFLAQRAATRSLDA